MKIIFISLLICFAETYGQSWQRVETIPEELVYFIYSDADTIYTATDSVIYISRDNGLSWSVLPDNALTRLSAMIRVNNILFAGTYGHGVFISRDQGKSWIEFNDGLTSWGKYISGFYLMNDRLYLGSDGGGVFYLDITNPLKWTAYNENLPSLVGWSVICMTGSGSNLIISAGASGFLFVRSEGSAGWEEYYVDSLKTPQVWSLLTIGEYVLAGTGKSIYRSSDHGINWDSVGISALPLRSSALKIFDKKIYAGLTRESDFFIWTSVDSGLTWQSLDHQFFFLMDLHITKNQIIAATSTGLWNFYHTPVSVSEKVYAADHPDLSVYPNPFNPVTRISINIPEESVVKLNIFNINGEKVAAVFNGTMKSGGYEYYFDGRNFSAGVYICTLNINGKSISNKIVLLK